MDLYLGARGATFVNSTAVVAGDFFCLYPMTDCVIGSISALNVKGDSLVGVTLPAGIPFYATVRAFSLSSGTLMAYSR